VILVADSGSDMSHDGVLSGGGEGGGGGGITKPVARESF